MKPILEGLSPPGLGWVAASRALTLVAPVQGLLAITAVAQREFLVLGHPEPRPLPLEPLQFVGSVPQAGLERVPHPCVPTRAFPWGLFALPVQAQLPGAPGWELSVSPACRGTHRGTLPVPSRRLSRECVTPGSN